MRGMLGRHRCKCSQPSAFGVYKRGGSLTALALAEGTASVESASGAERAAAAQPDALDPRVYDEARREGGKAPQRMPTEPQQLLGLIVANVAMRGQEHG